MKLVFLSREYPPETSWGGESVVIHNLSKAMAKCGHEIHVICQANTQKKEVVQDGVIVHRVGNNSKRYSAVAKIDYSIFAYFKLLQIIKKRKIDLVDAPYWSAEGFLFSFTKQIPLVVRTQSSPSDALRTKTFSGIMQFINLKLLNMLAKITAQKADKIISNSINNSDRIQKEINIKHEQIEIIHHGIDIEKYKHVVVERNELKLPLTGPIILHIGRLEARKGILDFCNLIPVLQKQIGNINFVFIGDDTFSSSVNGSFKNHLKKVSQIGNFYRNISFYSRISEENIIKFYSVCDVFCFPSLHESFGLPIIESMAIGKPVVTTQTGIALKIQNYNLKGFLAVPIGDIEKLALAIQKMINLSVFDKQMIANENRKFICDHFSSIMWQRKFAQCYETVISHAKQKTKPC